MKFSPVKSNGAARATSTPKTLYGDLILEGPLHLGALLRRRFPSRNPGGEFMGQLSVDLSERMELLKTKDPKKTKTGISFPRYFTTRLEAGKTPHDEIH